MTRLLILVLAIVIAVESSSSSLEKPGARAAITTKGFSYLCHKGTDMLKTYLTKVTIPDISGTDKIKLIFTFSVEYKISHIKLYDVDIPNCRITPGSNGLTLDTTGVALKVTAHLQIEHTSFPKIDIKTNVKIDLKDVSFSTTIYFGRNSSNGHATVTAEACSANIGTVAISFSGSGSRILNLLHKKIEKMIKSHFSSSLCSFVTRDIDRQGKKLEYSPFLAKVDDIAKFDYSLTQPPKYATNYMAVFIKGEFCPINKSNQTTPFGPIVLPPLHVGESMINVWITDYVVQTASIALYESGKLSYTVTQKLIPKNIPIDLNTTTLQFLIPSLYKHYPNMPVQIVVECTEPPQYRTNPTEAAIALLGDIKLEVIQPNKTIAMALVLSIKLTADLTASLENGNRRTLAVLKGKVSNVDATYHLVHSNIGVINTVSLFDDLNLLIESVIVPALNSLGKRGFKIPSTKGIHLANPKLNFKDRYIVLTTDVTG